MASTKRGRTALHEAAAARHDRWMWHAGVSVLGCRGVSAGSMVAGTLSPLQDVLGR